MKAVSIRNLPDSVYTGLREMAASNHRSMQEQIRRILSLEVALARGASLSSARRWRKRLAGREHSDSVAMIREDRQR